MKKYAKRAVSGNSRNTMKGVPAVILLRSGNADPVVKQAKSSTQDKGVGDFYHLS